jgi:hypothetical protein
MYANVLYNAWLDGNASQKKKTEALKTELESFQVAKDQHFNLDADDEDDRINHATANEILEHWVATAPKGLQPF